MREITGINLAITSFCNLACPDCCCDIPYLPERKNVTWDYLTEAARYFRGLYKINLTGGEPFVHPNIDDWAPKLKDLFQCEVLYVETNALVAIKHIEALRSFDRVFVSHYTAATYAKGSAYRCDNTLVIEQLKNLLAERIVVNAVQHRPRNPLNHNPCERAYAPQVAYWFGRLYPCCIGPGARNSPSVGLSPTWKTDVAALLPACAGCFFAEP
jgi:molybdenum cofactor biosynthesis enzyme MoaA